MTIELPPDVAAALAEAAARREMTPDALAAEILRDRLHPSPEPLPGHGGTLADFLAGYIGVFDSRESGGDSTSVRL